MDRAGQDRCDDAKSAGSVERASTHGGASVASALWADESLQVLREIRDALQARSIQQLPAAGDDTDAEGASS